MLATMLTYILLFSLIAVVILGVIRASKHHRPGVRSQKEPFMGGTRHPVEKDNSDALETVGKPRVIGYNPHWPSKTNRKNKIFLNPKAEKKWPLSDPEQNERLKTSGQKVLKHEKTSVVSKDSADSISKASDVSTNNFVVMNIIAQSSRPYQGYELLKTLVALGLHYGKWGIFHYHEASNNTTRALFSLASIANPGSFDLAKMSSFSTPGLLLFMPLIAAKDQQASLTLFLKTAHRIIQELGGMLCDEKRVPLDADKLAEWFAKVKPSPETQSPA